MDEPIEAGRKRPTAAALAVAETWRTRWKPAADAAATAGVTLPCAHGEGTSRCGDCDTVAPHGPNRCTEACEPYCTPLRAVADEVIRDNYGLAISSARKFFKGPHRDLMEAVAADAFYRAWLYFDPAKGSFGTHVRRWVTGACQEALHRAKFPHLSDRAFEKRLPIRAEIDRRRRADEPLDAEAIAEATGASVAVVDQHLQPVRTLSIDAPVGDDSDGTSRSWGDMIADDGPDDGIAADVLAAAGREVLAAADLTDVELFTAVAITGVGGADPVSPSLLRRTLGVDVADATTLESVKARVLSTDVAAFGGSLEDFIFAAADGGDLDGVDVDEVAWKALTAA